MSETETTGHHPAETDDEAAYYASLPDCGTDEPGGTAVDDAALTRIAKEAVSQAESALIQAMLDADEDVCDRQLWVQRRTALHQQIAAQL